MASSLNTEIRLGNIVAKMGAAVGLVMATRRASAAYVIKSAAVAMGMPYWLGSQVTVSLMRSRCLLIIQLSLACADQVVRVVLGLWTKTRLPVVVQSDGDSVSSEECNATGIAACTD